MRLNLIGSILGQTGYDSHCRSLFNALYKLNPDIKLDVPLVENWEQQVNDAELKSITKDYAIPDATISIMTPQYWRIAMGDNSKKFIGFCVWEGDKIPAYWIEYLLDKNVDQIWVPSKHTKDAIWNTYWEGCTKEQANKSVNEGEDKKFWNKVKIVPHGINTKIFYNKNLERKDKPFQFIINKGWRGTSWDRGGVQYAIKAFSEEFSKDENVELLVKLNPSYIDPKQLNVFIGRLKLPENRPNIKINYGNLNHTQINDIYNESDCFICSTRAEAFDLGSAEAMATGLPIITTKYGGQIEHMNGNCAWGIEFDMEEVTQDLMYEGIKWATPKQKELQMAMRDAFENREKTKEKGKKAQEFISSWTWDNSAKLAMSFLKES